MLSLPLDLPTQKIINMSSFLMVSLQRTLRWVGLIGVVASLAGWIVLATLGATTVAWSAIPTSVSSVVLVVFGYGLPTLGGVMVAFWITASVWASTHTHLSQRMDNDRSLTS